MLYAKTVCKNPGSYVSVLPVGIIASLQYSQDGILEKIRLGVGTEGKELTSSKFNILQKFVQPTIPLKGGTTWVHGVFYSRDIPTTSGYLDELAESYLDKLTDASEFVFYAGAVTSLCASFGGITAVKNWLNIANFNVAPGVVVPFDLTETALDQMLKGQAFAFEYPYFAGFITYYNTKWEYVSSGLRQTIIKSVGKHMSEEGFILGDIKGEDNSFVLSWNVVVKQQLKAATSLLYYQNDEGMEILATRLTDNKNREAVPRKMTCPVCHKTYDIDMLSEITECDDPHCMSHAFPKISHMLQVLSLPTLPYDRFKKAVESKELLTETDVFDLPEYKEIKPDATLSQAIKAATPPAVCSDASFFDKFEVEVQSNIDTAMYYLQNPNKMITEFQLTALPHIRFAQWVEDPANLLVVRTLLTYVHQVPRKAAFDGAPVLRGRTIVITGKFLHGDYDTIRSIIQSYSGTVEADLKSTNIDLVVVGDTMEEVSGEIIRDARTLGVLTISESQFFEDLSIDEDLAENLL